LSQRFEHLFQFASLVEELQLSDRTLWKDGLGDLVHDCFDCGRVDVQSHVEVFRAHSLRNHVVDLELSHGLLLWLLFLRGCLVSEAFKVFNELGEHFDGTGDAVGRVFRRDFKSPLGFALAV